MIEIDMVYTTTPEVEALNRLYSKSPDKEEEISKVKVFNNINLTDLDFSHIISECTSIGLSNAIEKVKVIREKGHAIVYEGNYRNALTIKNCLLARKVKAELV